MSTIIPTNVKGMDNETKTTTTTNTNTTSTSNVASNTEEKQKKTKKSFYDYFITDQSRLIALLIICITIIFVTLGTEINIFAPIIDFYFK